MFQLVALYSFYSFFFFIDTATSEIYTLSYTTLFRSLVDTDYRIHRRSCSCGLQLTDAFAFSFASISGQSYRRDACTALSDRKSTRLNSSHVSISYAVFCLKKKKYTISNTEQQ